MDAVFAERQRFGRFFYRFPDGEAGTDVFDRVATFLSYLWLTFGALYVMEAQGSLTPRRHGRSVRGTTTSVPHAPRAPLILTLTLTLSLSLALTRFLASHIPLRLGTLIAERTMYLPSVGAILLVAHALRPLPSRAHMRGGGARHAWWWRRAGALPVGVAVRRRAS